MFNRYIYFTKLLIKTVYIVNNDNLYFYINLENFYELSKIFILYKFHGYVGRYL